MKIIIFALIMGICGIAYASDISLEPLMNRVFSTSDNTIKATITGTATLDAVVTNWISADGGVLTIGGAGETNNENLTLNFETSTNNIILGTTTGVDDLVIPDLFGWRFGTGQDIRFMWNTEGNDSFQIGTRVNSVDGAGYVSIMEKDDMTHANRSPTVVTPYPTLRMYADNRVVANYVDIYHNSTDAVVAIGNGALTISSDVLTGSVVLDIDARTSADVVQIIRNDDTASGATLNMGSGRLWVSAAGILRFSAFTPLSDDAGVAIGG